MLTDRTHPSSTDVICLSHLRWNFVFQRPQHLMIRCARDRRVFFVEEPVFRPVNTPYLQTETTAALSVIVPVLPEHGDATTTVLAQRLLIEQLFAVHQIEEYVLWYYTPMALAFTAHLKPRATVYDCMDELSAFLGAPSDIQQQEEKLLQRAGLVLTGGQSLFEAKRHLHPNIHAFPSSVDVEHFSKARWGLSDPEDQARIPRPRLGFFGVVDERMDLALLDGVAAARPDWHLVIVGPVVKIDPSSLPHRANIHYLGAKRYEELPRYLAGWDVALLPFARNRSTEFISPTKTPEYLAAGKPVVSTAIRDVVRPYGQLGLVRIADDVPAFIHASVAAMAEDSAARITSADAFLRQTSWDGTWTRIQRLLDAVVESDAPRSAPGAAGGTAV